MENKFIESYIAFLNLKCEYSKEYISEDVCELIDNYGNSMHIMNFFEDVMVEVNGEKIGCFMQKRDRKDNSVIWVSRVGGY